MNTNDNEFNLNYICRKYQPKTRNIIFTESWLPYLEPCFKEFCDNNMSNPDIIISDYYWICEQYVTNLISEGPAFIEIIYKFRYDRMQRIKISVYFAPGENSGYILNSSTDNPETRNHTGLENLEKKEFAEIIKTFCEL